MPTTLPCFANGATVTSVKLTIYKLDATCTLAAASDITRVGAFAQLIGTAESVDYKYSEQTENLTAMNSAKPNPVPYEGASEVTFTGFLSSIGTSNVLRALVAANDKIATRFAYYVLVEYAQGGDSIKFYARMTEYSETVNRPKGTYNFTCMEVGVFDTGVKGMGDLSTLAS